MGASHEEILKLLLEVGGQQDAERLAKSLNDLGDQSGQSGDQLRAMVAQLDNLVEAAKGTAEFVRLSDSLAETEEKLDEASRAAYALKLELGSVEKPTKEMEAAFAGASKAVAKLEAVQRQQREDLARVGGELKKAGVDTDKLADENTRLQREATETAKALSTQADRLRYARDAAKANAAAFEKLASTLQSARDRLNKMSLQLTKVGVAAAATAATLAGYATARFFSGAIESAAEFEHEITAVGAIADVTGEKLDGLRDAAKQAATDAGFGFTESAKALGELARASGDADKAIAQLGPTLNLAKADSVDAAKAAEILTTTLTQFGLEATEAARVADALATVSLASTTGVEKLGLSLSYAAPLARELGLSMEDTVAVIGAMADEGFRGERSGTALRNVMGAMLDPASKFSKALSGAGIQTREFNEVVAELGNRGEEGKKILLALDAEARPAIMALVRAGTAGIGEMNAALEDMDGKAAETAKRMRDDLAGGAADAKLAFDNLRQELVAPLLEPLRDELQGLAAELNSFAESAEFEQIRQALATLFKEGVSAFKEFVAEVDFKEVAAKITAFANGSGEDLKRFGETARETAAQIRAFGQGMAVVIDGLQSGVLALTTAVAGFAYVQAEWIAMTADVVDTISVYDELAEVLGIKLPDSVAKAREHAAGLKGVVAEMASRTGSNFDELRQSLDSFDSSWERAGQSAQSGAARIGNAGAQVGQAGSAAAQGANEIAASAATVEAELTGLGNTTEIQTGRMVESSVTATERLKQLTAEATALQQQLKAAVLAGASPEAIAGIVAQYDALQAEIQQTQQVLDKAGIASEKAGTQAQQAAQGFQQIGQAAQQSSSDVNQATGDVARYGGQVEQSANTMLGTLQALNAEFAAVSENARQRFVEIYSELARLRPTVEGVWDAMREAAERTRMEVEQQRSMIEDSIGAYTRLAEAGEAAFTSTYEGATLSSQQLEQLAQSVREGRSQFALMNQADLDKLAGSIDRVRERVARLEEEARQATEELRRMADALQDESDRRAGNEEDILRRQHEERMRQIQELASVGGAAAQQEAERARRLAEQEYAAQLERLRQQREAERQAHDDRMDEAAAERNARRDPGGGSSAGGGGTGSGGRGGTARVEVVFRNEQTSGSVLGRLSDEDRQALTQMILRELAAARGGSF